MQRRGSAGRRLLDGRFEIGVIAREYLADVDAVVLAREAEGLMRAIALGFRRALAVRAVRALFFASHVHRFVFMRLAYIRESFDGCF